MKDLLDIADGSRTEYGIGVCFAAGNGSGRAQFTR
jgi:hypothetical protein